MFSKLKRNKKVRRAQRGLEINYPYPYVELENQIINVYANYIFSLDIEVLKKMRSQGIATPALMLTARDAVEDRVAGLDTGADDYLPKPFAASELLARVRAMLRRKEDFKHDVIKFSDIELDKSAMSIKCGAKRVRLNNKAFQLMEMLSEHKGAVLSINQIMERIWGWDSDSEINVVWVNISFLRKKLTELGAHAQIKAVRGVGYTLENTL